MSSQEGVASISASPLTAFTVSPEEAITSKGVCSDSSFSGSGVMTRAGLVSTGGAGGSVVSTDEATGLEGLGAGDKAGATRGASSGPEGGSSDFSVGCRSWVCADVGTGAGATTGAAGARAGAGEGAGAGAETGAGARAETGAGVRAGEGAGAGLLGSRLGAGGSLGRSPGDEDFSTVHSSFGLSSKGEVLGEKNQQQKK